MRYQLPNGRYVHLVYHSPVEWAERLRAVLLNLGCSQEYADASTAHYRDARPA